MASNLNKPNGCFAPRTGTVTQGSASFPFDPLRPFLIMSSVVDFIALHMKLAEDEVHTETI